MKVLLKKEMNDRMIKIQIISVKILGNLAAGLKTVFHGSGKDLFWKIMLLFRSKDKNLVGATMETSCKFKKCLSCGEFCASILENLKDKNPEMKINLMLLTTR